MSTMQRGTLATSVAAIVMWGTLAPHCGAQERGDRPAERREVQAGSFLTVSKIVGVPIQIAEEERIGVVHEILFDPVSCEQFVLIDTSGALDLDGMVVMPLQLFEFQAVAVARQPAVLIVNVPVARIRQAPIISATDIDLAVNAAWVTEVNTFFREDVEQRRVARPELDGRDRPDRPDAPDTDEPRPGERPRTPRTDDEPEPRPRPRTETPRGEDEPDAPRTPRESPRRGSDNPPETREPQPDRDTDPQPDRDSNPTSDRDGNPEPRERQPEPPPERTPETENP